MKKAARDTRYAGGYWCEEWSLRRPGTVKAVPMFSASIATVIYLNRRRHYEMRVRATIDDGHTERSGRKSSRRRHQHSSQRPGLHRLHLFVGRISEMPANFRQNWLRSWTIVLVSPARRIPAMSRSANSSLVGGVLSRSKSPMPNGSDVHGPHSTSARPSSRRTPTSRVSGRSRSCLIREVR